jgi:exodeoxyribonuclease VII large subunit
MSYSVTQINNMVQVSIASSLPGTLSVTGEVTDYRPGRPGGHLYFSLKDNSSVLSCVMWRAAAGRLDFALKNGMQVVVSGHVDVYVPGGRYQLIASGIKQAGTGSLQMQFEQLKEKLYHEGLFEEARKKVIPRFPFNIAIITSPTGAAVKDIHDSIHSRFPCAQMYLCPAPVQGKGAEVRIAEAIAKVNRLAAKYHFDLIIIGRGGGSLEDLWCFNEEATVRAIAASELPVISAVGHEIDTTLSDLAADSRASTPTKAGLIAVPDLNELLGQIRNVQIRLREDLNKQLKISESALETVQASQLFKNPAHMVNQNIQLTEELERRLAFSVKSRAGACREQLLAASGKLQSLSPVRILERSEGVLDQQKTMLSSAVARAVSQGAAGLEAIAGRLAAMNPRSVLERGYTMTTDMSGRILSEPETLKKGARITTEFAGKKTIESIVD